jgi:hypothetical protein
MSSTELSILDLIIEVAFDSDNGETSAYLNREAVASETYDGRLKRVHTYKYNESFSPKFTFTKRGFGSFTMDEVRLVLKWLTSTSQTALLDVYYTHNDSSETVDWSAIGGWTEINTYKLGNNRTIGITAKFEAITPYAMSDLQTSTKDISENAFKPILIDTDDHKPVYPRITIQQKGLIVTIANGTTYNVHSDMVPNTVYYNGSKYYWKTVEVSKVSSKTKPDYDLVEVVVDHAYDTDNDTWENGKLYYYPTTATYYWIDPYCFHESNVNPGLNTTSVRIINTHKDNLDSYEKPIPVVIKNNTSTEKIILDGANQIVSSSNTGRIFGDDFVDWRWLALYDGTNNIAVEGNCTVTLEWREVRKVGEW